MMLHVHILDVIMPLETDRITTECGFLERLPTHHRCGLHRLIRLTREDIC
jgi:hypothetical protein